MLVPKNVFMLLGSTMFLMIPPYDRGSLTKNNIANFRVKVKFISFCAARLDRFFVYDNMKLIK